jgi:hypothetical protein
LFIYINFHNESIRKDKTVTPYEAFTGQPAPWSISDFRVIDSPAYVFHKELQDGSTLGKWNPKPGQKYTWAITLHDTPVLFH